MLLTHSPALSRSGRLTFPNRWRRDAVISIPGVEGFKRTPEQPSRRALRRAIRYLFDEGIIAMHYYHGNQQKRHIGGGFDPECRGSHGAPC
jgi:hypothetical protein